MSAIKLVLDQVMFRAYEDGRSDRERGLPSRPDALLWDQARRRAQANGHVLPLPACPIPALLTGLREEYNCGRMAAQWSGDVSPDG